MADEQRLDGWKAIGNFLGRDRTTALRWAKERHLPVHRVPGGRIGTVYALRSELNDWLASGGGQIALLASASVPGAAAPTPASSRPAWAVMAAVTTFAIAITGFAAWYRSRAIDTSVGIAAITSPGDDIETQQFAHSLTADLARFANASAGLAVYEQDTATGRKPQYTVRTGSNGRPAVLRSMRAWCR